MTNDRVGGPWSDPVARMVRPARHLALCWRRCDARAAFGLALAGVLLAGCARYGRSDPPAGAVASTRSLIGATPKTLEASLGRPWLRRNDGGAEVWLYRSDMCRLDVFLYRAKGADANKGPRVSLATPMPHGIPARSCLASLERRTTS